MSARIDPLLHKAVMPASAPAGLGRSLVIALTAFLTVVDLFATQAILPSLTVAYGVSPAAMGTAVNAAAFGMAISGVATALLSERIDRRTGIFWSLALLAIPTALLAVAPDLTTFTILRVIQGLFMASAFTLTLAYLGESTTASAQASAFAAYITGNVASNLFGRLISAGVAGEFGLEANFLIFAGLNLAGAALVYATVRSMAPRAQGTATRNGDGAVLSALLRKSEVLRAFAVGFTILFAFIGTFTYVNFVLVRPPLGLGMMSLGLVYFVFLPSMLTTPLAGKLAARAGGRATMLLGFGVAALGAPMLAAPSLPLVLAGMVLMGIGTFFAQAAATGYVARAAGEGRAVASGLYLASYFLGGLAGSAVLGLIFEAHGWPATLAGIVTALAIGGALSATLKEPNSKP